MGRYPGRIVKSGIRLFLAAVAFQVFADDAGRVVVSRSPDEKFGVQVEFDATGTPGGVEIVRLPSKETVADLSGLFMAGVHAVWAPDSSKVAINGRAGGRYETAVVYHLGGDKVIELPSPEAATGDAVRKAMEADRKEQKIPPDASLRRIWDKWELRRWIAPATVEVFAYSVRAASVDGGEGGTNSVALRFALRLKEDDTWEILEQHAVAESEVLGD